jgi:hypothetical protein
MKDERDGYSINDLVAIGDHLHNSKTALVIADIPSADGKQHTTMGSAVGTHKDIVLMILAILEKNEQMEELITEAVLIRKANKIAAMFNKMNKSNDII